jgi:hypothetical protein
MENANTSLSQKIKNATRAHPYAQTQQRQNAIAQTGPSIKSALAKKNVDQGRSVKSISKAPNASANYEPDSYMYEDYFSTSVSANTSRNAASISNKTNYNNSSNLNFFLLQLFSVYLHIHIFKIFSKKSHWVT